jgi:hypothetical protein
MQSGATLVLSVALAMMQLSPVMTMTRSRRALKQMFFFISVCFFVIDVFAIVHFAALQN